MRLQVVSESRPAQQNNLLQTSLQIQHQRSTFQETQPSTSQKDPQFSGLKNYVGDVRLTLSGLGLLVSLLLGAVGYALHESDCGQQTLLTPQDVRTADDPNKLADDAEADCKTSDQGMGKVFGGFAAVTAGASVVNLAVPKKRRPKQQSETEDA